jgi:ribosomal protein L37AE/L43A
MSDLVNQMMASAGLQFATCPMCKKPTVLSVRLGETHCKECGGSKYQPELSTQQEPHGCATHNT